MIEVVKWLHSTLSVLGILLLARVANAHIALVSPKARNADQKDGPCGVAGDKRGTTVTTFKPGETITVEWKETVSHPGHFRISFDADGQDGFADPKGFTDLNAAPTVLVDGIKDKTGTQTYSQEVTLPDVECDKCTLQVIQVMTDKPPYGDGNDIYYQCADLVLSKTVANEEDAGSSPVSKAPPAPDSGCRASNNSSGSTEAVMLSVAMVAILAGARRKWT